MRPPVDPRASARPAWSAPAADARGAAAVDVRGAAADAPGAAAARAREPAFRRRGAAIVAFAVAASLAFHFVPAWLAPRWAPPVTLAVLLALDAACVALCLRSAGSVLTLSLLTALAVATWAMRTHALVVAPSALLYAALAVGFGATLRRGSIDLISRVALQRHGPTLGPDARRYFRRLTAAWALFFALLAIASVALAQAGSFAAWSLFVNVLTWPLMGAMFLLEWAVRRTFFRDLPPDTPIDAIAATLAYRPGRATPT